MKGLAEREVTADLALWPLRYVSTGDDLTAAQAQITRVPGKCLPFSAGTGIDTTACSSRRWRSPMPLPTGSRASAPVPLRHPANRHGAGRGNRT